MSSRKKKRSCLFSSAKGRPKKAKKTFDKEWTAKLAESDKGSFYNQEKLLDELHNNRDHEASAQAEMSASRRKIQLQETVEAEEIDEEKWTKLKGRSIVSGERLQERLGDAVSCRFCQGDVNIMENVLSRNGLGSSWIIRCQNESCPSQSTSSAFTTTEKGKGFEVNRATVLGLRSTGCGRCGLEISKFSWTHTDKQKLLGYSNQNNRGRGASFTQGRTE